MATLVELMNALPDAAEAQHAERPTSSVLENSSMHPVPVGRLRRLGLLGTLQAKIGAAYLFHWLRGWFRNSADSERLLAETHHGNASQALLPRSPHNTANGAW